jgi:rfaE bifunctional protein kinase chain/domain
VTPDRLREITDGFPRLRVAVVGDFCLDRYLEIDPARAEVSIETGLPVHNVTRVRAQPGAAGTVLANLAALGVGELLPVGWCGDDGEGYELRRALAAVPGVELDYFTTTPLRRTFTYCKPLVVSLGELPRELNRLDSKNWEPTPQPLRDIIIDSLTTAAERVDAVVVLDQVDLPDTGVVTADLLAVIREMTAAHPRLRVVADSRRGLAGWPAVTFKMNAAELAAFTGRVGPLTAAEAGSRAADLARATGHEVVVTLAERGLVGATPDGEYVHAPALPVHGPIDVVGAGDSVTASLTAALATGATLAEALTIAVASSSVVVHKLGTTGTATPAEIAQSWAAT